MHIEAKIQYVTDDSVLNIHAGQKDTVDIDEDYLTSDEDEVISAVEYELEKKLGHSLRFSRSSTDSGDFVIENMSDILADLDKSNC